MADLVRRNTLRALSALPLAAGIGVASSSTARAQQPDATSRSLVAFFTRTGNTRVIANQIRRATTSDMFEIVPAEAYTEDYEETVAQARRETEAGFEPALAAAIDAIASYDVVYLGFPIWGTTAPPVIRAFLSNHDLAGKTLVPFITHGGYGVGSSLSVVAEYASQARLVDGLVIEADQERRTLEQVTGWLGGLTL